MNEAQRKAMQSLPGNRGETITMLTTPPPLTLEQMKYLIIRWYFTEEIRSPAHGNNTYIGFPSIGGGEGDAIAQELMRNNLGVVFCMGEFMRCLPKT